MARLSSRHYGPYTSKLRKFNEGDLVRRKGFKPPVSMWYIFAHGKVINVLDGDLGSRLSYHVAWYRMDGTIHTETKENGYGLMPREPDQSEVKPRHYCFTCGKEAAHMCHDGCGQWFCRDCLGLLEGYGLTCPNCGNQVKV